MAENTQWETSGSAVGFLAGREDTFEGPQVVLLRGFVKGDRVELCGLNARPELNGLAGTVLGVSVENSDRLDVVDDGDPEGKNKWQVRAANLRKREPVPFQLMTFNVFQNKAGAKSPGEWIDEQDADIICTQEDPGTLPWFQMDLKNYKRWQDHGEGSEIVAVYIRTTINNQEFVLRKKICENAAASIPGASARYALVFEYRGVTIAVLHLEGGREVDTRLGETCDEDAKYYDRLLQAKIGLLEQVLEERPHIIMGDFNSAYHTSSIEYDRVLKVMGEYYESDFFDQKRHLQAEGKWSLSRDELKAWSKRPFELLQQRGYIYARPENEDSAITSARSNNIVDMIWFREPRVYDSQQGNIDAITIECNSTEIKDIMEYKPRGDFMVSKCTYSDHNPVVTEVKILAFTT